jgi:HD-GYP domain-containing protein (c-di-GMP phosphodiesterase class II)
MIQVTLEELSTKHVLARSIFRPNGELLLSAGYRMTDAVLKKLYTMDQTIFWVQEEGLWDVIPEQLISEYIMLQTTNELRTNANKFKQVVKQSMQSLEDIQSLMKDSGRFRNLIAAESVQRLSSDIISDLMHNEATMVNLNSIRTKSNYIYEHSLDVSIVCLMLAKKFGFNRLEMEELALGSLLLDTGYLVLPEEMVNKKGRITFNEFSILKEHPTIGYTILRENPKIPLVSAHIAYQHHERQDGGGYPRRLKGMNEAPIKKMNTERSQMHRYAEVAAVADFYVSMSNPRPGSPRKTPQEIIKVLLKSAGSLLNKKIVDALITMIPVYPVGARIVVILDPGRKLLGYQGVVSKTYPEEPERPDIILIMDEGKNQIKPVSVSLREQTQIIIQHAVLR